MHGEGYGVFFLSPFSLIYLTLPFRSPSLVHLPFCLLMRALLRFCLNVLDSLACLVRFFVCVLYVCGIC